MTLNTWLQTFQILLPFSTLAQVVNFEATISVVHSSYKKTLVILPVKNDMLLVGVLFPCSRKPHIGPCIGQLYLVLTLQTSVRFISVFSWFSEGLCLWLLYYIWTDVVRILPIVQHNIGVIILVSILIACINIFF